MSIEDVADRSAYRSSCRGRPKHSARTLEDSGPLGGGTRQTCRRYAAILAENKTYHILKPRMNFGTWEGVGMVEDRSRLERHIHMLSWPRKYAWRQKYLRKGKDTYSPSATFVRQRPHLILLPGFSASEGATHHVEQATCFCCLKEVAGTERT